MESRRKGADLSNVFAVCLSKHVPESWKHAGEYTEKQPRDSEDKKGEAKKRKFFMNTLE